MPWGKVTINYKLTGYRQNYKRDGVVTHVQCQAMVAAAIEDSIARIGKGPVEANNIAQNLGADPGNNFREI